VRKARRAMLNNPDFYPTPKHICAKMVGAMMDRLKDIEEPYILEPSAGKGDLAEEVVDHRRRAKLFVVESDPDLQATLIGKGMQLAGHDFMTYSPGYRFDGIVMNPPFSAGAKHLLRAWEIVAPGGVVVCLLNEETLANPHTRERQLLKDVVAAHGSVERLGCCFTTGAERRADVNVAMVTLFKDDDSESFEFFGEAARTSEKSYSLGDEQEPSEVAVRDVIGNLVIEYEKVKEIFADYYRIRRRIGYHAGHVVPQYSKFHEYLAEALRGTYNESYNSFVDSLRRECWENVFSMSRFGSVMTRKVRDDFEKFQRTQQSLEFTKENIEQLFLAILSNGASIRQACIEEVFDYFTRYYEENRIHPEGWKSNDQWMASRKVVLPYISERWCSGTWHMRYGSRHSTRDIDIAMNAVTGKRMDDVVTIEQALENAWRCGDPGLTESTHFCPIRYYKKGTVHLTFRDEFTWKEFNIRACRMKGWLPGERSGGDGKKA